MDPDSDKRLNDLEIEILKQRSHILSDDSNVLQSSWIRRTIQASDGLDRFLLVYGFNFLWPSGIISWAVFLLQKIN